MLVNKGGRPSEMTDEKVKKLEEILPSMALLKKRVFILILAKQHTIIG